MKNLVENNLTHIGTMTPDAQYQWYLRIKESLPKLKGVFSEEDIKELEIEVANYEKRNRGFS